MYKMGIRCGKEKAGGFRLVILEETHIDSFIPCLSE
jgi:hypothetical protein